MTGSLEQMNDTNPQQVSPESSNLPHILALLRREFAYMEGRINPPSSLNQLTIEKIAQQCQTGEVWTIGQPPHACIFLRFKKHALYLGKLAVSEEARGQGRARTLVDLAERRALALGLPCLELETRVELTENHQTFTALGFVKTGESAHDGFDHATSIVMQKRL